MCRTVNGAYTRHGTDVGFTLPALKYGVCVETCPCRWDNTTDMLHTDPAYFV